MLSNMKGGIKTQLSTTVIIITAPAVLHNIAKSLNEAIPDEDIDMAQDFEEISLN